MPMRIPRALSVGIRDERIGAIFLAGVFLASCGSPRRPSNVPMDSVFVEGAKTGWWQHCDNSGAATHCAVWNEGGQVLLDEEFLPLDGGAVPALNSAKLRRVGPCTGVY